MARMQNLDRLLKKLERIPKEQKRALRASLEKSAAELVQAQRALAPVDDGTLRASIRTEPGRHELAITVTAGGPTTTRPVRAGASVTYDYALAQEFGTQHQAAQPFFFPAYRLLRKRIAGRARSQARKAARQVAGES